MRSLTLAGWVPWLLDSVTPDPTGRGFDYVDSVSVLLRPGRLASRCVPGWRARLTIQAARQLFHLCTYSTTDEARINRVRGVFVELGIPLDDASHNSGHTTLCTP